MKKKEELETNSICIPGPDQVGRNRSEDFCEDFPVPPRSIIQQVIRLLREGICHRIVFPLFELRLVGVRRCSHERSDLFTGNTILRRNEAKVLCGYVWLKKETGNFLIGHLCRAFDAG